MSGPSVRARIVVSEVLGERTWRGRLPNGREIFVYVPRLAPPPRVAAGDAVIARLSLGDFSRGEFEEAAGPE